MVTAPRQDRRGADTRERILDAAEHLFAHSGYDRISIRDITQRASVNLALVTYHFGTKDGLFEAVFERRAEVLNHERLLALGAASAGGRLAVRDVLRAFVRPYLKYGMGRDAGWRNYCRLIAMTAPVERWSPLMARLFDETAGRFIDALIKAEPAFDRETAGRALLFGIGTMLAVLRSEKRLARLLGPAPVDTATIERQVEAFLTGGVLALVPTATD